MNNDLTIATKVFAMKWSDKTGSFRSETVRGINLPTTLQIAHQTYTDQTSKRLGTQSKVRFDRHLACADGTIHPITLTLTVRRLNDTAVTSAEVLLAAEDLIGLIQEDDTGLNLLGNIVAGEQ